ncbi:MAG: TetR/AcrR family transcriptional regulator [Eubacteriaceae bacterium]|nr:TetR/AcrR family transcriptional regulator [Eubacteriaceae bacterium]
MEVGVKERIADAMYDICCKKDPGKVTVKDIVTHCNVSRQIFYYYYQDIYDVIAYILERDINKAVYEESIQMENPLQSSMHFVGFIMDKVGLINKGLESKLRADVEKTLLSTFQKYMRLLVEKNVEDIPMKNSDIAFIADFLACGLMGEVLKNCIHKEINVEVFCNQLMLLVHARLEQFKK